MMGKAFSSMKFSLIALALTMTSSALAAVGDTYDLTQGFIAEGVAGTFYNGTLTFDKTSLQNSTRFYDSQKGWVAGNSTGDSYMCWAHTASNMIQYWQSYYGVFYKGDTSALPYGSKYQRELYNVMNPSNSPKITDPMRLDVMKSLYNSGFYNMGGEVATGTNWFFTWVDSQGGYYSEYFGAVHQGQSNQSGQTATITGVNSLSTLKEAILPALGLKEESNGSYTQTESGLIAHLNVTDGTNPHTLTCYGLTLNADGSIKSLIIADSDDCRLPSYEQTIGSTGSYGTYTPKATQLFVGVDASGKLMLYTDEACQTPFISGYSYYVSGITRINTPEVLQHMLAEYSDVANEAQVWNGSSPEWNIQKATTEELPTSATGWDIHVDGDNIATEHRDYYHTYSTDGRDVLFSDHAEESKRAVTVTGEVKAQNIEVTAAGYRFTKGTDAAISAVAGGGSLNIRSGGSLSSEVSLNGRNVQLEDNALLELTYATSIELGDLTMQGSARLTTVENATVKVTGNFTAAPQAATLTMRSSPQALAPSIQANLDLTEADSITLATSVNMNGYDLILSKETPITLELAANSNTIPLFTDIGTLTIGDTVIAAGTNLTTVLNIQSTQDIAGYSIIYAGGNISLTIPEPATATLSILALAALATRRRRK